MLVVSFVIMSSKKNSRKCLCPGCKLAAPAHNCGLLNKFCTGPGTEESEDGAEAIDTAEASPISAQCNPVQPTAELNCKQLDRFLTTEIGKIQLEQTALKDKIKHLGKGSPESSCLNTQATTLTITLPSGNNEQIHVGRFNHSIAPTSH